MLILLLLSTSVVEASPYAFEQDPSGLDPTKVSLPEKNGTLLSFDGKSKVNGFTGNLSYTIPVDYPKWRDLWKLPSISYSSQGGNGILGQGFSMGFPRLFRTTQYGVPNENSSIHSSLDGELSLQSDGNLLPRINRSWHRYEKHGDGYRLDLGKKKLYFGQSSATRLGNGKFISEWLLDWVEDSYGNRLVFSYEHLVDDRYSILKNIFFVNQDGSTIYASNFEYEERGDKWTNNRKGYAQKISMRLTSITQYWNQSKIGLTALKEQLKNQDFKNLVRINQLALGYEEQGISSRSLLTSFQKLGNSDSDTTPITKLSYSSSPLSDVEGINLDSKNLNSTDIPNRSSLTRTNASFVDFNGDGLTDILAFKPKDNKWFVWINKGKGSFNEPVDLGFHAFTLQAKVHTFGDFNGDRRIDFLYNSQTILNKTQDGLWGPPAIKPKGLPASIPMSSNVAAWVDFNGDSKIDYIFYNSTGFLVYLNDSQNSDIKFKPGYVVKDPQDLKIYHSRRSSDLRWLDFNGDGLADLSLFQYAPNKQQIAFQENQGDGHFGPVRILSYKGNAMLNVSRYGDINGDGLTDLIFYDGIVNLKILINDGQGGFSSRLIRLGSEFRNHPITMLDLGDINGNGSTDLIFAVNSKAAGIYYFDPYQNQKHQAPFLLEKVEDELGQRSEFTYESSRNLVSVENQADQIPVTHQLLKKQERYAPTYKFDKGYKINIVESVDYRYKDGYFDYERNEFYGYQTVSSNQAHQLNSNGLASKGVKTDWHFYTKENKGLLKGLIKDLKRYDIESNLLFEEVNNRYETLATGNNSWHSYTSEKVTKSQEQVGGIKTRKVATSLTLSSELIPSSQTTSHFDVNGNLYRKVHTQFVTSHPLRLINIPKSFELVDPKDNGTVLRKRLSWNDDGDLEAVYRGPASAEIFNKSLEYDNFGNVTQVMNSLGYQTTISYEHGYDFLPSEVAKQVSLEDPSRFLTEEYRYAMDKGAKVSLHYGQNHRPEQAVISEYKWDGLSRLQSITMPGQNEPSTWFTYTWGSEGKPSSFSQFTTAAREPSTTLADGLMRTIGTVSPSNNGGWLLSGLQEFGLHGKPSRQSMPISISNLNSPLLAQPTARMTTREYDYLKRLVQVTHSDGGLESWQYFTNGTQHINQEEELRRTVTDHFGRTCLVEDIYDRSLITLLSQELQTSACSGSEFQENSGVSQLLLSHNLQDQISELVNAGQPARTYFYDRLGRNTEILAGGLGTITMAYNEEDQLTERVTSSVSGKVLEAVYLAYDGLGRELSRDGALGDSKGVLGPKSRLFTFSYDDPNAKFGLGRLSTLKIKDDIFDYDYDVFGNVERETFLSSAGNQINTSFEYDEHQRLTKVIYPDNSEVRYIFDERNGHTKEATGSLLAETAYDDLDRLASLSFKRQDLSMPFSQIYSYDEKDRVRSHTGSFGTAELFTHQFNSYDKLDRILEVSGANPYYQSFQKSYRYDSRGQISNYQLAGSRLDQGMKAIDADYSYDPTGDITKILGKNLERKYVGEALDTISLGNQVWSFGDFGRLSHSQQHQDINWNSLGQISTIKMVDGSSSSYGYKPDLKRLFQETESVDGRSKTYFVNDFVKYKESEGAFEFFYKFDDKIVAQQTDKFSYNVSDNVSSQWLLIDAENGQINHFNEKTPFGGLVAEVNEERSPTYLFAGGINDRNFGLDQMRARYYSPELGRFISPDPLYLEQPERCISSPLSCNLYTYAGNNPLKYIDPSGLDMVKAAEYFSKGIGSLFQYKTTRIVTQVSGSTGFASGGMGKAISPDGSSARFSTEAQAGGGIQYAGEAVVGWDPNKGKMSPYFRGGGGVGSIELPVVSAKVKALAGLEFQKDKFSPYASLTAAGKLGPIKSDVRVFANTGGATVRLRNQTGAGPVTAGTETHFKLDLSNEATANFSDNMNSAAGEVLNSVADIIFGGE
ncbi:FG-GAP-like repeat-containing protein [Pseudobacteriovorax antillogorgiicola]|uniref:FG-GAP-like repeat-containing protein n=1 Tax=Pseudobacteriovorax antillogorgiicola TaxID=1513793 RepID=UPI0013565E00|nr:FG-GAP-like repeat-containing protein [Pseudobacteriovorax antillogorgiicola]